MTVMSFFVKLQAHKDTEDLRGRQVAGGRPSGARGGLDSRGDPPQLEVGTKCPTPQGQRAREWGAYRLPCLWLHPPRKRAEGPSQGLASPKGLECAARHPSE